MHLFQKYDHLTWEVSGNSLWGEIDLTEEAGCLPDIDYNICRKFSGAEEPMHLFVSISATKDTEQVTVAMVELYLMNAFEDRFMIADVMDDHSADAGLVDLLLDCEEYEEQLDDYMEEEPLMVGVLQEMYVMPEFRRSGIGRWINGNLSKMLRLSLNINIGCLITQVRPYQDGQYGVYIDGENEMTGVMCRFFEHHGWRRLQPNIYIKDFTDEIE